MEPAASTDPAVLLRSGSYAKLLVLAAIVGVLVSAVAYGFLKLVDWLQGALFEDLPGTLGFTSPPAWWPLPMLVVAGLLTGAAIRFLPGVGGHSPADGLTTGGPLPAEQLPGVVLAALATLSFGVVLGPESPLIIIGAALARSRCSSRRRTRPTPLGPSSPRRARSRRFPRCSAHR